MIGCLHRTINYFFPSKNNIVDTTNTYHDEAQKVFHRWAGSRVLLQCGTQIGGCDRVPINSTNTTIVSAVFIFQNSMYESAWMQTGNCILTTFLSLV
mmetsp:Transcript_18813/g.21650  ORF Transcript_18813/g.21650 Transcript_18813/m.21650 type:complete len:97 (+) Transcript_18813:1082-1372(+)